MIPTPIPNSTYEVQRVLRAGAAVWQFRKDILSAWVDITTAQFYGRDPVTINGVPVIVNFAERVLEEIVDRVVPPASETRKRSP